MQARNRDAEVENRHVHTVSGCKGKSGTNWESSIDIDTLACVKQPAGSCNIV